MPPDPAHSVPPEPPRRRGAALVLVAAAGLGLVAVPWLLPGWPMSLLPRIEAGSPEYRVLLAVAQRVDAACARGDVEDLRASVTAGQWLRIGAWLEDAGRGLDAAALQEQGYLVGDLEGLPFLHGASGGRAAALVFYRGRPALGAGAGLGSLFALVFVWDGSEFLLHEKRSEALGPKDDRGVRAGAWAAELLDEAGRWPR